MNFPKAILHIDGDAFFASCEQAMHPEWKGRPVVTGKERGIVSAASYEAKARGVSRGVPLWEVKTLCPDAIIVPSDYETYSLFSERMFAIMRRYSSQVEEYGIDEGFVDITGLQRPLNASYEEIAAQVKAAIESELGITVSVGLSVSKVLAKLGSKWKKPAGLTIISARQTDSYLRGTPVEKLWGVGARTAAYCEKLGIRSAYDFARQTPRQITARFTKPHVEMWQELNGQSVYAVDANPKRSYLSIGKTKTFTPPSSRQPFVFAHLLKNLENACIKARRHELVARGVVVYLREQTFKSHALEATLTRATAFPQEMLTVVGEAFRQLFDPRRSYRATGIVLVGLKPRHTIQLSLFDAPVALRKLERVYESVDSLSQKFGKHTVYLLGAQPAHMIPQHARERGDIPLRKLERAKGEGPRHHLAIPLLLQKI